MRGLFLALGLTLAQATPALAEFATVTDRDTFIRLVNGKVLTRPLVKLRVAPDGSIAGKGAGWDVNGAWTWKNGYFCRDLIWGGDDLGYNCQRVLANGNQIRFVADQGQGDSADFRLR
ncbi:dihydrodipicolinate reductase [Thetidibacter halocola]|uniref:Dihydrodipicolinate reductase n=1 Tax=Thetidibacter halocola TaxID=2827239 RepID=A0A8J7WEU8_9RHOB|nr:dihydrodipicolinate reductase [Thetidibacter halocola]MBS0126325.1 dihydrodipicolinate reductase [Thetidibacter halocola]